MTGRALRPEVRLNKEQEAALSGKEVSCQSSHTQSSPSLSNAQSESGRTAGSVSPGSVSSALASEGTQTVPGEEAVMKRLTAEELRWLQERLALSPNHQTDAIVSGLYRHRHALLAMASRLVEVESALNYLHRECPMSTSDYEPGALLLLAKQLGWTSPTQKPNDGGRDG